MTELRDLYQEVILDHYKRPRNFGELAGADHHAEGHNPLCGDHVRVALKLAGDVIEDVRFQGSGCAISKASASLMTGSVKGKTRGEVEALFDTFHDLVTGQPPESPTPVELGKLTAFSGVSEFPLRVKCASLAWHTLMAALKERPEPVSTE